MTELRMIPVEEIVPNSDQPRVEFDLAEIESLAESIREHGQVQPITVVERQEGYTLVDGERRLRATKLLGRALIRAEVRGYEEPGVDGFLQAAVANMQRVDLNPIEEGETFRRLKHERGMTLYEIARLANRSYSHVQIRLHMLDFAPEIRELFAARRLPIDPNTITNLFKLPEEVRGTMAKRFAMNGVTAQRITASITRYLNHLDAPEAPLRGRRTSEKRGAGSSENRILQLSGRTAAGDEQWRWQDMVSAAEETCAACDLNDVANAAMCKDCPAVELLRRLGRMAVNG